MPKRPVSNVEVSTARASPPQAFDVQDVLVSALVIDVSVVADLFLFEHTHLKESGR